MGKRNKIRYTSKGNQFPPVALSGRIFVKYRDEEAIAAAQKGDLMFFLSTDSNPAIERGAYDGIGIPGYLKLDVFDGRDWKPVSLEEFFPGREYYYSKYECPSATIAICRPILETFKGRSLLRKYREHYALEEE
jgi:hypothetical protein